MSLESANISGFFNGISQQAPTSRQDTQCELQENALGTLVDGLVKRPPTEHVAILQSAVSSGAFVHKINRDVTERYIVMITGDATNPIEVFTIDGVKCTVRYGDLTDEGVFTADSTVKNYVTVSSGNAGKLFKAITVVDRTIITRKDKVVAYTDAVHPGSVAGTVQTFTDLPGTVTDGDIYEVTGDDLSNFDNFFMKWTGSVWVETMRPGLKYQLHRRTMPHQLARTGTNEFTFAPIYWADRTVGDNTSNPAPSFHNNTINNVFFFKNRLGFLSDDNVVMSQAGDYWNFWRKTALDLLDSDPIDTSATAKSVETLRSTAIFDKSLLILADQQQFDLGSGDSALSPVTAAVTPTTRYQIDPDAEPITAGANVYFVCPADPNDTTNGFVSVREYFIQPDSMLNDAADVTAHVPRYIPQGYIQLDTCNSQDVLFAHTDMDPSTLYVYKYYWMGNEKPQSAWSRWTFDGDILGFVVIHTNMFIVIKRDTQVYLEKLRINKIDTGSLPFRVHLDRQITLTGSYNTELNTTTWTLPYTEVDEMVFVDPSSGLQLNGVVNNGDGTCSLRGDWSSKTYIIGKPYTMRYRLSEWYLRRKDGSVIMDGRLQIRTLTLSFTDTGYFRLEVTPFMRETLIQEFTGAFVGLSVIGQAALKSGEERFIVMAKSKQTRVDIVNDSYMPCQLQTGTWEGLFTTRAGRRY